MQTLRIMLCWDWSRRLHWQIKTWKTLGVSKNPTPEVGFTIPGYLQCLHEKPECTKDCRFFYASEKRLYRGLFMLMREFGMVYTLPPSTILHQGSHIIVCQYCVRDWYGYIWCTPNLNILMRLQWTIQLDRSLISGHPGSGHDLAVYIVYFQL